MTTFDTAQDGTETIEMKWSELQNQLEPLSLILFRGQGIVSDTIVDLELDEDSKKLALKFGSWYVRYSFGN